MSPTLEKLRAALPSIDVSNAAAPLRTGLDAVDDRLPNGGFGAGTHEVWADESHASAAASVLFVGMALASGDGAVVWCLRRRDLFAPALAEVGLGPGRVIYAEAGDETSVLAVAEEALRHGGLAGVVAEVAKLSLKASRRLQLAAEETGTPCFVLRRPRHGQAGVSGTACLTRWQIGAIPSGAPGGPPRARWRADLTRCRGSRPGTWCVEVDDEATPHRLRLVDAVAAGAAGADTRRSAA